jgi:tetratricopeptide (TPR) repeat protein
MLSIKSHISLFIAVPFLVLGLSVGAAKAEDWPTCKNAVGAKAIAACSHLIASGGLAPSLLAIAYNNRGNARLVNNDLEGAIVDLDQALRLDATLAIAHSNRCLARLAKRNIDGAIEDCNEAIRLNPKLIFAYDNRCSTQIAKGDLDRAISDCGQAIRLDPKRAGAFGLRCGAWIAKGKLGEAVADCDEAIRLDPNFAPAYSNRCFVRIAQDKFDNALADCDYAIRLNPKLAPALGNRCRVRMAKGESEAALLDCNSAIEIDPNYTGAYVSRGLLFEQSGDRSRAIADFQTALAKPPKYLTAKSFQDVAREHLSGLGISTETGTVSPPAAPLGRMAVVLKMVGGTFVVPVAINGAITLNFIIDSGAADVTLPSDVVGTLIRTGTIERSDFIGTQTYILADGSESPSSTFVIRSLKVGDVLVENVQGSIVPAAGNLLLGQSFLRRFKSWSIDNMKRELVLEPLALP